MLIQLSQDVGSYLYDVFVARFDSWLVYGVIAQLLFAARFLVQWIASERAGRSVMPITFWFLSIAGGLLTLIYGLVRREPDPDDRRAAFAVITEDGRAALRKAAPVYLQGIEQEFLSHLTSAERRSLERALRKVLDAQRGQVGADAP